MIISTKNLFLVSWVISFSLLGLICLLPVETASSNYLILVIDKISAQYLPNALAMAGDSAHQVQIRVCHLSALLLAVLLALMTATLVKGKTDLKTDLRRHPPHVAPWAAIAVLLLVVAWPFFPFHDEENYRVSAISETVRASRVGLLLFSYTLLVGYFVAWFIIFLSIRQILRNR